MKRTSRVYPALFVLTAIGTPARGVPPAIEGGRFTLSADPADHIPGLVGSYVNQSLHGYTQQDDWQVTQVVAGTRIDVAIDFDTASWGSRASVGVTGGGSDADWDDFSVQWDGYVHVLDSGTRLATETDDGSRMWIDVDRDGVFSSAPPELLDNGWGASHAAVVGDISPQLPVGTYKIRIQYYEDFFGTIARLRGLAPPTVRVAHVVPSNRTATSSAITNLEGDVIPLIRGWFCEQMDRNGAGRLAPRFERDAAGAFVTHQVTVSETDAMLRGADAYGANFGAVTSAGVAVSDGEVWVLVPEAHLMHPDGTIEHVPSLGTAWGWAGAAPGGALAEGTLLAQMTRAGMLDDRPYGGLVLPGVGPYGLVQDVSFAPWGGPSVGTNVSNLLGAFAHEMTHGFGLPHDGRNEMNAGAAVHGNLMGTGFSHFRGALFPGRYGQAHTRLSWGDARALAINPYFEACASGGVVGSSGVLTAGDAPAVAITSSGPGLAAGHVPVSFSASDPDGLALARLLWDGNSVDEMVLSGTSFSGTLRSAWFEPGTPEPFEVVVYDTEGNRGAVSVVITPEAGANRAPRPAALADPPQAPPGSSITLRATPGTEDPDDAVSTLTFEWQLSENGNFVSSGSSPTFTTSYSTNGVRLVRVRVTDPHGASATSAPVALRVAHTCSNGLDDDGDGLADIADPGCGGPKYSVENPPCNDGIDNDGDNAIDLADSTCLNAYGGSESPLPPSPGGGCGLGPELAPVVALLGAARGVRKRRSQHTARYPDPR